MDCPRCGLINPDIAERCDCGYDFATNTVERAYFQQKLPTGLKWYFRYVIAASVLHLFSSIGIRSLYWTAFSLAWTIAIYLLYFEMTNFKKAWARYALMVLTAPIGTALLLMREVKLYMLQKE